MKASLCMPTCDRPEVLQRTLESIYSQRVPFDFETIVVDDGSIDCSQVCLGFPVTWVRIHNARGRHTPSICRNIAYRHATGEVIISQSDDVLHHTPDTIERLVTELQPGTFVLGKVLNIDKWGRLVGRRGRGLYVGSENQRPLFFLGSLWKRDLYAIGGCDQDFGLACEDTWFSRCLMSGLGLTPIYADHIVGWHQDHPRSYDRQEIDACRRMYWRKVRQGKATGQWVAAGGPWA